MSQKSTTLGGVVDRWIDHAKARGKQTYRADARHLDLALDYFGVDKLAAEITLADLDKYRTWVAAQPARRAKHRATSTVNCIVGALRAALNQAVREGAIKQSSASLLRLPAPHNDRDRVATSGEITALLAEADRELRLAILLGIETGMRQANVANLRWSQIDLELRVIRLPASETKQRRKLVVPLSAEAIAALSDWAGPGRKDPRNRCSKSRDSLFSVGPHIISQRFGRLARRLNLSNLRYHDLRHTSATATRRAGVDLITLMRMFGWRSFASVLRYQHVDHSDLIAAVDKRPPLV